MADKVKVGVVVLRLFLGLSRAEKVEDGSQRLQHRRGRRAEGGGRRGLHPEKGSNLVECRLGWRLGVLAVVAAGP